MRKQVENHKTQQPPTGQGLRITITIESTNPPIEFTKKEFVSYSPIFKHENLIRRVKDALDLNMKDVLDVFNSKFADEINRIYYPKGE